MLSPGESLKQERQARGRTIEEMAEATGIRTELLAALEEEAFDSLPGRGFCKLYIRAYAEVLGFDPRPVIEAYDQAFIGWHAAAPTPEQVSAPRPITAMLARWRQERMAERAAAGLDDAVEAEPEPEEAEPESEAADEEIAPRLMEGPVVPMVPSAAGPAGKSIGEVPVPKLPVLASTSFRPARSLRLVAASLFLLVLLPLVVYVVSLRSIRKALPVAARYEPVPREAVAPPPPRPPPPRAAHAPRTPPPTPIRELTAPLSLEVAESAVGRRLVGARLEGEGDRFRSGQRVTFATRVLGGVAGDSISHVWLRDGKVEQSIRLPLGGASWRTYSTKTLGRPGAWAVEARDEQGRVLARADLIVVP